MEAARDKFWPRLVRFRAILLLVFQITIPIAGVVYMFVRGADARVVALIAFTIYSLEPSSWAGFRSAQPRSSVSPREAASHR